MMPRAVSAPPQGLQPACMFAWRRHRVGLRIHGGQFFDGSDHGTKGFLLLATL
jgi:hypothetical protein